MPRPDKFFSPQSAEKTLKTSFAAKNAKIAKENTSSFFNFAHIAFFAAEKLFLCALRVFAVNN